MFIKDTCDGDGCPQVLNPVCGSEGNGFPTECALKNASAALGEGKSLTVVHKGTCACKNDFLHIFFFFYFRIFHTLSVLPSESHFVLVIFCPTVIFCLFEKLTIHFETPALLSLWLSVQ